MPPEDDFFEAVERIAKDHRERCKTDPILRAEHEMAVKQRKCRKTHKRWDEDWDVHGPLDWYCARCGVPQHKYSMFEYSHQSFMTCDEILAERKK